MKRRRNPSLAWHRGMAITGRAETHDQHNRALERLAAQAAGSLARTAARVRVDMSDRQKRAAAVSLVEDKTLLGVLYAVYNGTFNPTRARLDAAIEHTAAAYAPIVDAEIETIEGRWRGAQRHTRVPRGNAAELEYEQRAVLDLYQNMLDAPAGERIHRALVVIGAAERLISELVQFDKETQDSFWRLYDDALLEKPFGPMKIKPRRPPREPASEAYLRMIQRRAYEKMGGK